MDRAVAVVDEKVRSTDSPARIGVATAELYPRISLGLGGGSTATSLTGLFSGDSLHYSVGPLINWTLPLLGSARARVRETGASNEAALATFDKTVLEALQETEIALTRYAKELDRHQSLKVARDQTSEAVRLVNLRFQNGAENFLAVLDSQRTLASTEAALATSDAQITTDQISVFKALGGGWQVPPRGR